MKEQVIQEMKDYFGSDEKRINHALHVLKYAEEIAEKENITDKKKLQVIQYTTILHDIGIHEAEKKYHSTAGKYQEQEGPPIAEQLLKKIDVDQEIMDRILFIIANHHTYSKIDGKDFQVLWEADMLVNLEEKDLFKDKDHYPYIDNTFKTDAGKEILKKAYQID